MKEQEINDKYLIWANEFAVTFDRAPYTSEIVLYFITILLTQEKRHKEEIRDILDEFELEFDERTTYPNGKDADWQMGWNEAVGRMVIIKSDIRQKYGKNSN